MDIDKVKEHLQAALKELDAVAVDPKPEIPGQEVTQDWKGLVQVVKADKTHADHFKVVALAQFINESGRGTSKLAKDHLNFAGIKYRKELSSVATPVEYKAHDGIDNYAKFKSVQDFYEGYWLFMARSPYKGWASKKTAIDYLTHLKNAGYAESSTYIAHVSALFPEAEGLLGVTSTGPVEEPEEQDPEFGDDDGSVKGVFVLKVGHHSKAKGASMISKIGPNEYDYYKNEIVPLAQRYAKEKYPKMDLRIVYRDGMGILETYQKRIIPLEPDGVIELHFNASTSSSASGTETLCSNDLNDKAFATIVQKNLCEVFGRSGMSRGVKPIPKSQNGGSACHAIPGTPNCLIEPAFGSNTADAKMMMSRQKQLAEALIDSFAELMRA